MDSLHVSGQPGNSKTSSRSASPCRPPRSDHGHGHHQHHHAASGYTDGSRSQDGLSGSTKSRHRSPTLRKDMDEPSTPYRGGEHLDDSASAPQLTVMVEPDEEDVRFAASFVSNGSSEHDEADGNTSARNIAAIQHLNNKIIRTRDSIRLEQTLRDDNVNEYLKLAANADKQQLQRIKAVFEKKNQKSAHVISQLQKKLDNYNKRLRELETHGVSQSHRPPREVLRDMGQGLKNVGGNIRDGITGLSGSVMAKPREFAHLIKNKFGSADNINQLSTWYIGSGGTNGSDGSGAANGGPGSDGGGGEKTHHGSATLPAGCALHAANSQGNNAAKFPSEEGSECSSVTSESFPGFHRNQEDSNQAAFSLKPIFTELQERREEYDRLSQKLDAFKSIQQEVQYLTSTLQEERFRAERLEEQINDLTELHQNEVENLKQALADMEEKVQYQSEERLRDIHEMLEHCQTKIQKMEHQAAQQQQYVTLEGLDNSNARALVVKLINVVLTVLQVVLLLVATAAGITMPFLRTRVRILTTVFIVFAAVFVLKQWPEVRDIGTHIVRHLKETLDPVQ